MSHRTPIPHACSRNGSRARRGVGPIPSPRPARPRRSGCWSSDPVGVPAQGTELRVGPDWLAQASRVAGGRWVEPAAPGAAGRVARSRAAGLVAGGDRPVPRTGAQGRPQNCSEPGRPRTNGLGTPVRRPRLRPRPVPAVHPRQKASSTASADAASNPALASANTAPSSNAPSGCCTGAAAACASAGRSATTSTKPSSALPPPSSAGDDSPADSVRSS